MSESEVATSDVVWPCPFAVGETFESDVTFDAAGIRSFATLVGDTNPLHHDEAFARQSRFGRLIACGAQTSSIMIGRTANIVTQRTASLGLDLYYRFRRAVLADEPMHIRWTVASVTPKPSHKGYIVGFEGEMVNSAGEVAVSASAKSLVFEGHI
ncbi:MULTISPECIES: MaoC family dehydratase [unclassified Beijerinckia]|uniref:MaoC family dehydratase n=1 Tax=unclassified Beijerinckia TaxID=2638183 RepID=UPI00089920CB|nr:MULTISPECIES: MaoC family dehydratase [unclassified Beijerinckia]MDH7794371.1 3-hydroxybutyryl-CoA dehydratase [Beijerinckia sp. GAS462]SEB60231.1 Acyl dehydratase [Beijerinckia sp. 28-YEA-48]